jgi:hypothetical protein
VVASGVSAVDGLRLGRTLTRHDAVAAVLKHRCESKTETAEGAYGCNMFVRSSLLASVRFDERLPLDSWLEDYDFSVRCNSHGLVVWNFETCVAHIGASERPVNADSWWATRKLALSVAERRHPFLSQVARSILASGTSCQPAGFHQLA